MRLALRYLLISSIFLVFVTAVAAQYTGYTLKGGPTMGIQNWDGFDRQPTIGMHVSLVIENLSDTKPRTLYAALGLHQRGSAIVYNRYEGPDFNGNIVVIPRRTQNFRYNNLVLALGAKQTYAVGQARGHIAFGVRGEYTVTTNLDEFQNANQVQNLFFPQNAFVTRLLYGIDVGTGIDVSLTPSLDGLIELRISPDLSRQYFQPPIQNVILPGSNNNPTTIGETSISNISFELSIGLRLVKYEDYADY